MCTTAVVVKMVFSFGPEKFIYTTGYCLKANNELFQQLFIDVYRIAIGYFGSGVILLLIWMILRFSGISNLPFLAELGKLSLGVYLMLIFQIIALNLYLQIQNQTIVGLSLYL